MVRTEAGLAVGAAGTPAADDSSPTIWAVVLNWKDWRSTRTCVESLQGVADLAGIVIVDNAGTRQATSRTSMVHGLPEAFRRTPVTVVHEPRNLGFAAGMNVGVRHARRLGATAVLVLNNDLELRADALHHMATTLHGLGGTGAVGARIEFPAAATDHAVLQCLGGGWISPLGGNVFPRTSGTQPLDYLTGACVLVAGAFLESDLFDERFFMYWEDVDLGTRLTRRGVPITVADRAVAEHALSASRSRAGDVLDAYWTWSAMTYSSQAGGFLRLTVPARILVTSAAAMLTGRRSVARAKLAGVSFWARHRGEAVAHLVAPELQRTVASGAGS